MKLNIFKIQFVNGPNNWLHAMRCHLGAVSIYRLTSIGIPRPSYLQHENPHAWKRRSLCWDRTLVVSIWYLFPVSPILHNPAQQCYQITMWCELVSTICCNQNNPDVSLPTGHAQRDHFVHSWQKRLLHPGMMCLFCDYFYFISPRGLRTGCLV